MFPERGLQAPRDIQSCVRISFRMKFGRKLRKFRVAKKLTQADIEARTGLKRSYTSRVENDLTAPTVETLERYCHVLEIPLYRLFYDGDEPAKNPIRSLNVEPCFGMTKKERKEMRAFAALLSKMNDFDRSLLVWIAQYLRDAMTFKINNGSTSVRV
jgi:transcriptional regulator with XRE-family HTH domain